MMVPRRRTKSRGSRSLRRFPRSPRSRRSPLRPSLRLERSGRVELPGALGSRTFTTVITPSSSIVSPGVTPSPVARLRRRRRGEEVVLDSLSSSLIAPASSSSDESAESVVSFSVSRPRRRPLPPRRRRRRSALASSLSFSTSEVLELLAVSLFAGAALVFLGATSSGAA